jgi:hypothetical protein
VGQIGKIGVSSDGKVGEMDVDIRGSKVVASLVSMEYRS